VPPPGSLPRGPPEVHRIQMFRNNNDFCRPEKFYVLIETDVYRDVRSPEGQVVTEELHDQSAVLVGLLAQGVQL
jgi:hypothetical protein